MIGGWGIPPAVLANMCEFMQIHIKPELFKLVDTLREKNLKNVKSQLNFILTGTTWTSCKHVHFIK